MRFIFQNNRTLIIDNEPMPIGSAFAEFINIDFIQAAERFRTSYIESIESETAWDKNIARKYHEFFKSSLCKIHQYFCAYDEYLKSEIDRKLREAYVHISESPLYQLDDGEKKKIRLAFYNVCMSASKLLDTAKKVQNIFAKAAHYCLDMENANHGNKPIDCLYEYGIDRINIAKANQYEKGSNIFSQTEIEQVLTPSLTYEISDSGGSRVISELWEIRDVYGICYLEFFRMISNNILIKKCSSCGQYFLPPNRIDTAYCDRVITENGKTCKDIGAIKAFQEKVRTDPALAAYNKAYQSMYAKIVKPHRTNLSKREEAKDFLRKWSCAAQRELEKVRKGIITVEQFADWLDRNKAG
jgi:hypothetical protein